MPNCPSCLVENSDELNFCIECEKQIRCLGCSSLLHINKSRCLICGEALKAAASSKESMNTYTLEEKSTTKSSYRRIEITASDNAVDVFVGRLPLVTNSPLSPIQKNNSENSFGNSSKKLPSAIIVESESQSLSNNAQESEDSNSLTPKMLFSENSDHGLSPGKTLRSYLQDLASKKERQQIYALMFVWAHNHEFQESVSHENLVAAMKHEDLYDSNSSKHLQLVSKDYFKTVDNHYEINNYDGIKRVEEILENIRIGKQPSLTTEQRKNGKRVRSTGIVKKSELDKVEPWLDLPLESVTNFDTRKLKSTSEWCAFGLYILTKILKIDEAVESGLVYVYLSKKFPKLAAKRKAFNDCIRESKNKFSRNANGNYFLNSDAEKSIKEIIEKSDSV
jgi:hypothetical protein